MDTLLLDTNIILDADSANILEYINCAKFSVSKVVLADEVVKQIKDFNSKFREINETHDELISFYLIYSNVGIVINKYRTNFRVCPFFNEYTY